MEQDTIKQQKINENLDKIKHKILVLSGKGGVGKSTIAANLALALSKKGYQVGILDSDIHGPSIPKILGIENKRPMATEDGINPVVVSKNLKAMSIGFLLQESDDPIIWRGPLKMGAIKQFIGEFNWGKLDFLIIDLPPGTGDEPLSIAQLIPNNDGAIIVTTPQDVALLSVKKSINFVKKMGLPIIGIIENMSGFVCPHCHKSVDIFKSGGGLKISKEYQVPYLGKIPLDPNIVTSGDTGNPYLIENSKSHTAKSFLEIAERIEENVNKKNIKKGVK